MSGYDDESDSLIILVDRGNCSFATKVYYGEMVGAGMVIIVNQKGRMFNNNMFMVDDGNKLGTNIGIPSMMMSYEDGIIIENQILNSFTNTSKNYSNDTFLLATFDFVNFPTFF